MKKRATGTGRKQEKTPVTMSVAMQQLMLPLLLAMDATKKGLLSFVQQMGMVALSELLATEAALIAGPKGKHIEGRTHHHWGTGTTPVCFGGRNVSLPHPRVRTRGKGAGGEVALPSIEALRDGDPMSDRVVEQIALGVSTRGYERSLDPVDESIETRGASKSNASRALIDATTEKLAQFVSRKLDDVDLVAMFIDGIEFAGHSVLIALGVTIDGTKTPLGIWAGSTENTVVVTELLSNLVARGLRVDASMLFVIDGGKAIRKALRDVFGDRAIVQRCQVHKARNVRDHLTAQEDKDVRARVDLLRGVHHAAEFFHLVEARRGRPGLHQTDLARHVREHAPLHGDFEELGQSGERVVDRLRAVPRKRGLEERQTLRRDLIETSIAQVRKDANAEHAILRVDAARLLTVGACVAVDRSRSELAKRRDGSRVRRDRLRGLAQQVGGLPFA